MMNFSTVKSFSIPEGAVNKIQVNGVTIWELPSSYTNKVPTSIDTNGSIFNGTGYIGKTRLSSSGATKTENYNSTTGYIRVKANDVIRVPSQYFDTGACYVCSYNSSFGFICAVNYLGSYGGGTVVTNGNVKEITLLDNSNIAYVRVSMSWGADDSGFRDSTDPLQGPGENMIVTVNQEITN